MKALDELALEIAKNADHIGCVHAVQFGEMPAYSDVMKDIAAQVAEPLDNMPHKRRAQVVRLVSLSLFLLSLIEDDNKRNIDRG